MPAAVEAGLLPWQLAAPLSREVVLAQGSGSLLIVGGLEATGSSADGVYSLDTRTGRLSLRGSLPRPAHDAAGARLGGVGLVIGGGTAVPADTSQRVSLSGSSALVAALPQARADAVAVTIGATGYIVGGYDGAAMDREVLATRNGHSYSPVASLAVPVRYPAVAALDGRIYVFGGSTLEGRPLSTVQVIDVAARTASVIGRLPFPLAGAAAAVLGGTIYLAGGRAGSAPDAPTKSIFAFVPARASFLRAGSLQVAVANAGSTVDNGRLWIVGGETAGGRVSAIVQVITPNRGFGVAGRSGAGSPFYGDRLLIADRGNDRLLVLNDTGKVVWTYPSRNKPGPPGGFYFPDDAFFIHRGKAIISNQEDNDTIVEIAFPSGRILFQYGHPRNPGSGPDYLDSPDDTYLLPDGNITVADSSNCRVLILDPRTRRVVHQIGTSGHCVHIPPTELGSPNGDTPLADGNLLISEVNGSWVDEYTKAGRLIWDTKLAIGYPSDPQQLGPDRYLIADYEDPGGIIEFDRTGRISYRYQPPTGSGALNHPSLVELLPSGAFMLNDDYNDRMVAIDPATQALVWQYGVTAHAGTAVGLLNTPDGFDLLEPDGHLPTHPTTG
jgi:outer membrane protein assembly factor BamB